MAELFVDIFHLKCETFWFVVCFKQPAVRFTGLEAVGAADSIEATKVVTQAEPTTIGAKIPVV